MPIRRDVLANPWNGVNLGGWLLLEPGPSFPLFSHHLCPKTKEQARCEWDLLEILHRKGVAAEVITQHRETHTTLHDFERIRQLGFNAIRLPIGYWVILGATSDDIYVGPALEYVDRAVGWAEQCGLQMVLDLHGCPGGESGEAPCGRRQRPDGVWQWNQWRFTESIKALRVLAERYRNRKCVTGISVCNEPSNEVPLNRLCRYYEKAVNTVRMAGMPASRVAVLLPVFQRPEDEFIAHWQALTGGKHRNICFDVHCYHCFENEFNGKTLAQQLRWTEENASMLRKYPMVVGEWSLALGRATWSTCGSMAEENVQRLFAAAQMEAFRDASHGSFFWNWSEEPSNIEWNFQQAHAKGLFSAGPRPLPALGSCVEDPLEEMCHPSPAEPRILFGDAVYLRVFHGSYIDVVGSRVSARWPDKGAWQTFEFHRAATGAAAAKPDRSEVRSGDVVRLKAHAGQWLCASGEDQLTASRRASGLQSEFVVYAQHGPRLQHRSIFFLQSKATQLMVDADPDEEGVYARYCDTGEWQQLAVEKANDEVPSFSANSLPHASTPRRPLSRPGPRSPELDEISPEKVGQRSAASGSPKKRFVRKAGGPIAITPPAKSHRVR